MDGSKYLRSFVRIEKAEELLEDYWPDKLPMPLRPDFLLNPIKLFNNPFNYHYPQSQTAVGKLVLCEVLNADGTPHESNTRSLHHYLDDNEETEFELQQEYSIEGFPNAGLTRPIRDSSLTSNVIVPVSYTGRPMDLIDEDWPDLGVVGQSKDTAYCGTGSYNVAGRKLAEEHLDHCLDAGIFIKKLNAEGIVGQWKYYYSGLGSKNSADDMLMSRYIMQRLTEEHNVKVTWIEPGPNSDPYKLV